MGATARQYYDVTQDDQRFVMVRRKDRGDESEIIVVENFFEDCSGSMGGEPMDTAKDAAKRFADHPTSTSRIKNQKSKISSPAPLRTRPANSRPELTRAS